MEMLQWRNDASVWRTESIFNTPFLDISDQVSSVCCMFECLRGIKAADSLSAAVYITYPIILFKDKNPFTIHYFCFLNRLI